MTHELINNLREREKELNCLYKVHEILRDEDSPMDVVFRKLIQEIPKGWQYPGICMAKIEYENFVVTTPGFFITNLFQEAEVMVEGNVVGTIKVYYNNTDKRYSEKNFMSEEQQLLNTISQQLSQYTFNRKIKETIRFINEDSDESEQSDQLLKPRSDFHWQWRFKMAEEIVKRTDFEDYGIEAIYLIGSVKEATAGPRSDIDLLVHFRGNQEQEKCFRSYIQGWSQSLSKLNKDKTGLNMEEGIIDLHIITDIDIQRGDDSYASMIKSYSNTARLLKKNP